MANAEVKGLLSQLRKAAEGIKAQIYEADDQIAALSEQRRALTDSPVSKADLMEFVRADIQRRASNYQWLIDKWAREAQFPFSFMQLEHAHQEEKPQSIPYLDGIPQHDGHNIDPAGIYWNFGGLIAERFADTLDRFEFADNLVPVADRRRLIAEIDKKLQALNAKRDGLADDLTSSGMYE